MNCLQVSIFVISCVAMLDYSDHSRMLPSVWGRRLIPTYLPSPALSAESAVAAGLRAEAPK
jgi:hypothetical protein